MQLIPKFHLLLIFLFLLASCQNEEPKNIPEKKFSNIFEANQSLAPGINFGNALEAPQEGEWGVVIKDEYIHLVKEAGFKSVRLPIRWSTHAPNQPPYTIEPQFFQRVKHIVDLALANDLTVVINIHHFEELCNDPTGNKEKFLALWFQIANFFKDYTPQLFFEICNEPHGNFTAEIWNQYFEEARQLVRNTNPTRPIIVGTAEWGGITALDKLQINPIDTNLIVTIHYYEPFQFTHQGAEWVEGSNAWLGTTWTATTSQISTMRSYFQKIKNWAEEKNRPIYIGEFGAYQKADMTSRSLWTNNVVKFCQEYNFSYAYWEFCAGFGIYDPNEKKWREPLLGALMYQKP